MERTYRAGDRVEDRCRACKLDRHHTVIVADASGQPLRVQCDYCGSQHNFRGGGSDAPRPPASHLGVDRHRSSRAELPLVSERERIGEPILVDAGTADLELLLRRVIRQETGITPVAPAEKWRGGTLALRPANPALQERTWPVETFFHKVVMIRNRLRTLEQQINGSDLPPDVKVKLQGYISGCYGSLTSFNVLFAEDEDQFKGSGE